MRVRSDSGFTLVELVITVAVIAIVATIAIPAMSDMVTRNRTTGAFNELKGLVAYARSESVKNVGESVLLCASNDGAGCTNNADWSVGWLVVQDSNGNGAFDSGEPLLKVIGPLPNGINLSVKTGNSTQFNSISVAITGDGAPAGGNPITFKLCDSFGASEARGLIVSVSGQVRDAARDSSGNREDHRGVDFKC
ncbi:GspH/FimT family pseudopilin [Marinobacter sp. UBA3607]|uniref:GspH/FimT family pseudopilin n=1 Tax=Marinobacter sp. UBA3607 TaxID=1946820 RepID=UPI00257AD635|nr:GspH/FimT family pseudopilin [Marinobacter sp. UBA3607]|tara:strand:- start:2374 stop:2955 length:582 start_codon:yes stop_codon:yes gene_type:complete